MDGGTDAQRWAATPCLTRRPGLGCLAKSVLCSLANAILGLVSGKLPPRGHAVTLYSAGVLRLVQPCTAQAQKLSALPSELKGRSRMALRRLHITL